MRCYICGEEFRDNKTLLEHAKGVHIKQYVCFQHGSKRMYPILEKPERRVRWGESDVEDTIENKEEWIRYRLSKYEVVLRLNSFPEYPKIKSTFLKREDLGLYDEDISAVRILRARDVLDYIDITSFMTCRIFCKRYNNSKKCPLFTLGEVEKVRGFEKFLLVVMQGGNGLWCRALLGVNSNLSSKSTLIMRDLVGQVRGDYYVCLSQPCRACKKRCLYLAKGICKNRFRGGVALESLGVDVTALMYGLDIPYQMPVFNFVTRVGGIFYNEANWEK